MKKIFERFYSLLTSLRFLVFILIFLAGFLPVLIMSQIFVHSYKERQVNNVISNINGQAQLLNTQILSSGYLSNPESSSPIVISELENIYSGRILVADRSLKIVKDTYEIYDGRNFVWEDTIRALNGETTSNYDKDNHLISVVLPIVNHAGQEDEEILGVMAVVRNTDAIEQDISYYRNLALIMTLVLGIVFFILAILFSILLSRPLYWVNHQLEKLEAGKNLEEIKGYTEIGELIDSVNAFIKRVKVMDTARQEFVSNVSHELKTPLTSVKILADSLNASEDTPVEFYKEFMQDITQEVDRETKIIDDLLQIVRLESSHRQLDISATNMNELLERIMKQLQPLAQMRDIDMVLETFRPVTVDMDEVKFSQALINLIENAIKYNRDGGYVHVSVNCDHQYCFLRVEDNGIGIGEDALPDIFERFFRADKSHSREIEGTGLGLSITRDIILMHHGEIKVGSIEGEGTTFDIRMPLIYVQEDMA